VNERTNERMNELTNEARKLHW